MYLKKVAVIGFVTTVILSTVFFFYFNFRVHRPKIMELSSQNEEWFFKEYERSKHSVQTSPPSLSTRPCNSTCQMESIVSSHNKQPWPSKNPGPVTPRERIAKSKEMIQNTITASHKYGRSDHNVLKPHFQSSSEKSTTAHTWYSKIADFMRLSGKAAVTGNARIFFKSTLSSKAMSLRGPFRSRSLTYRKMLVSRKRLRKQLEFTKTICTNDTCLLLDDRLSEEVIEDSYLNQAVCMYRAALVLQKSLNIIDRNPIKCTCHLQGPTEKDQRVGLVSLPGSGNTWVRGLLEQVTHICTGSMWCDANLRATQFCAEGLRITKTLIVKNHDTKIRWRGLPLPRCIDIYNCISNHNKPEFDAVIFVHRNPFDSLVAERNRALARSLWMEEFEQNNFTAVSSNDHILYFGKEYFCNNSMWNETVYKLAESWGEMVKHLLVDSKNYSVLLVHYEDLKRNLFHEMKRMMAFLKYDITEDTLTQRLKKQFNVFYRNQTSQFEHFTSEQKNYVNSIISEIDSQFVTGLPLKQYIHP